MAIKKGRGFLQLFGIMTTVRQTQRKQWRYFFINKKPYKMLRLNYPRDELYAWSYFDKETKLFSFSDVRRTGSRGFTFRQVVPIVHRTRRQILNYIYSGELKNPPIICDPGKKWSQRLFSEEDILKIQEIMASKHYGRPRADGYIRSKNVPSRQEIHASIKHDLTLYVVNKEGKFVPLYQAEDW